MPVHKDNFEFSTHPVLKLSVQKSKRFLEVFILYLCKDCKFICLAGLSLLIMHVRYVNIIGPLFQDSGMQQYDTLVH